jgi:LytS/YehU family sensor histidine kinase
MLIQPLLENAIKHGITTRQDQKNLIQVKISLINSNLLQVLVINDTGKLTNYNKKEHLSTAINTIKERLQLFKINGNSGRFNLNIEEKLTTAQLVIPIQ